MADRSARLARWCARGAYAPLRWPRLAVLGALVVVTTICAVWNATLDHQATGQPLSLTTMFDYAYAPFLYLVPQAALGLGAHLTLPEAAARITGPLISLLSVMTLAQRWFLGSLAELLIDHSASGYALVIADEGSGDALAIASVAAGEVTVLVDPGVIDQADRLAVLGTAGVICRGTLPRSLARAGTVVLWRDSDASNIARAADLRAAQRIGAGEIHLSVQSVELQRALLQVPDLMLDKAVRLHPHSRAGDAIRAALAGPQLAQLAKDRGQSRVSLCLWGMTDAMQWAAETALRHYWSAQLMAPRIILADWPQNAPLPAALAHFAAHAEAVFGLGEQGPEIVLQSAEAACADPGITCHLVDAGADDATLEQAFALAARLRQLHAEPSPVQPVLCTARSIAPLFETDKLVFLPPILVGEGVTVAALRDRVADQAAAQIHLAYDRQFGMGGTVPASGRWQDLPETYVAANRAAADHKAIKQWDRATSGLAGEALLEAQAEAEHNRWCAERLLAGWVPAGEVARDNDRRLHPDLRPWAVLSDDVREKDRAEVRSSV